MKHLKKFENISIGLKPNPKWDNYVTDLFNQYIKIVGDDDLIDEYEQDIDIIIFFNNLQDEIDDSESIDVWEVYTNYGGASHFFGLVKAYGELHAFTKMAIEFRDPEIIIKSEAFIPEEEEIENNINRLKGELEKWTKIY
jgi:hypothetical protein